jgi:hypothetical protein
MAGVKIVRVAYKGTASSPSPLCSARSATFVSGRLWWPRINRSIAGIGGHDRTTLRAGTRLPTVAASGLPGWAKRWHPWRIRTGATHLRRSSIIEPEIVRVLNKPDVKRRFFNSGTGSRRQFAGQFADAIKSEMARMGKVFRIPAFEIAVPFKVNMMPTRAYRDHIPDSVLTEIAEYVERFQPRSKLAWATAHDCLLDSLGCAFEALAYPECMKLVGPAVPGTRVPNGARVPGTSLQLDPVDATFSTGALVRWVDYSDAFFGAAVIIFRCVMRNTLRGGLAEPLPRAQQAARSSCAMAPA